MKHRAWTWWLLGILLIGNSAPRATAGLLWDSTVAERVLPVGVDLVEVKFAFSNSGAKPINIIQAKPSCGCTVPTLEKYTFAAGEKGVLTVLFDGKNMIGVQTKTIQVTTDDEPNPTTLTLRMTIPVWIEASPRLLWWAVGEESKAKEALVTLHREADIKITSVSAANPAVSVSLQPMEEKGRYRLIAKPVSTAAPFQTMVTIGLEVPGSAPRSYVVLAQVR